MASLDMERYDVASENVAAEAELEVDKAGSGVRARAGNADQAGKTQLLDVRRHFTVEGEDPFELVEWERRDAVIGGGDGGVVFEKEGVEFPTFWSQLATNVVTSKYFRSPTGSGEAGGGEGETSLRQLITRVVETVRAWGLEDGYFASVRDADAFRDELAHVVLHQKASFNSPVWFNCGVEEKPQVSACFINAIDDSMDSILRLARTEGMLFKYGSGAGANFSPVRSSREHLSGGGVASGPVNFMRGFDAFAGVIKSGGKTRRAAKMVILNDEHPDIMDFIESKVREERKAWALIDAGYDGSFNGEAYGSVYFQNANHSVRVSNAFMRAVERDEDWQTRMVTTGEPAETYRARDIMHAIAEATHLCGDPGMQFDTTVNDWHTCPNSGRINASNPCSEYMFLDNSACNLSSLNLMRFIGEDGELDTEGFAHTVQLLTTAMEIFVSRASYPTPEIDHNSERFRPLGLGFANLGALLMARGLAYDSDEGRDYAAAVTALMTGEAYATSARIAAAKGPFEGFAENRDPFLKTIRKHRAALGNIRAVNVPLELIAAARQAWDRAAADGERHGFRNAQVTVLAPTGTIAFMMDCDTTGIEPDIALVKYKRLVGGGQLKIVNQTVASALEHLEYTPPQVRGILEWIDESDTIEGAPELRDRDLAVFDCAFKPARGTRSIRPMGHLRMMAAVQPFLSGAISKTVNMPESTTVEEIEESYIEAWRLGLKSVAIYRDNSKRIQPLSLDSGDSSEQDASDAASATEKTKGSPYRRRLPDERQALTHKFSIGGHEGYITVGMYEDGTPGEIFIVMAKTGSVVSGLMDSFATAISMALQYGVPLRVLIDKFSHTRFEPSGFTQNREIPMAKSVMDYLFRWLSLRFSIDEDADGQQTDGQQTDGQQTDGQQTVEDPDFERMSTPEPTSAAGSQAITEGASPEEGGAVFFLRQQDAPPCPECGSMTIRNGSCYKCMNCGSTTGCS